VKPGGGLGGGTKGTRTWRRSIGDGAGAQLAASIGDGAHLADPIGDGDGAQLADPIGDGRRWGRREEMADPGAVRDRDQGRSGTVRPGKRSGSDSRSSPAARERRRRRPGAAADGRGGWRRRGEELNLVL
jgi:hypothetical protein